MGNYGKTMIKRIIAVSLCALAFISFMPGMTYALEDQSGISSDSVNLVSTEPEENSSSGDLADEEALLEGYMDNRLNVELGMFRANNSMLRAVAPKRRDILNDNEKYIYDALRDFISRTAAGEESTAKAYLDLDSVFRPYYTDYNSDHYVITSTSLGISSPVCVRKTVDGRTTWPFSDEAKSKLYDFSAVINALMVDEPYAFYWYDKTAGLSFGINGLLISESGMASDAYFLKKSSPVLEVSFTVSEDYRNGDGIFSVDTAKTGATTQAVTNAAAIISANESVSDVEKLYAYKDAICALTSYNSAAAYDIDYPYGDPWQMIYVFDDDETTKVVCEGYSKAFQYLCDHTRFIYREIDCDIVSGIMMGGTGAGNHMWNILHMDDGRNYIADITNSDNGTLGRNGGLFLSKAMENGTVTAGYKYDVDLNGTADLTYIYDDDTRSLYFDDELEMATSEYIKSHVLPNAVYTWKEDGSGCSAEGICEECGDHVNSEAVITSMIKVPATCNEMGVTTYTASFGNTGFMIQTLDIKDIPINDNHSWNNGTIIQAADEGRNGIRTYTCTRCGLSRTEVIPATVYPTDLPNAKILKPKAGKKKVTVKWKKVSKKNQKKIQGIEIQIAADPGFSNIVKTANVSRKKTSKVIKGLKSKTTYYVRIRAYKNADDGRHVSVWKSRAVKIK